MATASRHALAVVVGVGPGLGSALCRRFALAGYSVAMMARNEAYLKTLKEEIATTGGEAIPVPCDASSPDSIHQAFSSLPKLPIAVLIYNASAPFSRGSIVDLTTQDLESNWNVSVRGAFVAAKEVVPGMLERGSGTILFTGATASLRGGSGLALFAMGKFGLRALGQSLARELGPKGIHVAHVIIDGAINTPRVKSYMPNADPGQLLDPDALAETYWFLHQQHKTTWTQELDLRPNVEKF